MTGIALLILGLAIGQAFSGLMEVLRVRRKCADCGKPLPKPKKPGTVAIVRHDLTSR